ncbi:MAG: 50S ribosomal protein L4 [Bacillota bacterium]|jgi:large subunit ribosomal protein L4|nr:50S ribosomal protein L4 [Bacillota bacterium]HOA90461.1 50S ribosomal protein L4 [Bacillota bacterium]HOL12792.1 50S ribosomal protein L4 [Bacillota bacterium]HOP54099.1 50S ribosomal protein L4 [Bacillota bacterium]HPQ10842.1 50S ribosomal protein L4 [Bacillota bacterium]
MPQVTVYDTNGKQVGELQLNDKVFGAEVNKSLMHEVVVMHLARQRVGTAATKTRSMVRGGGRKPWRQKGTGRARQGSIRAPQWRKGGIVFGPQPRDFSYTMPKKARRAALCSALSAKVQSNNLIVLDDWQIDAPKTKEVVKVLKNLNLDGKKALIVTADNDAVMYKSARNIEKVAAMEARNLNTYEVLNYETLIMTKDAVAKVEEVLS